MNKVKLTTIGTLGVLALSPLFLLGDVPYTQHQGSLSAVNDAVTASALQGQSVCTVAVSGTFTGTVNTEGTIDSTWFPIITTPFNGTGTSTTITAPGNYSASCSGLSGFRVRLSAITSGSVNVTLNAAQGTSRSLFQNIQATLISPNPLPVVASSPFPVTVTTPLPVVISSPNPIPITANSPIPVTESNTPYSFFQTPITGTSPFTVKGSAGVYYGMTNISKVGMPQQTTCFDNATLASGTVIAMTQLSQNANLMLTPGGIPFANGLTCVNSGNLSGNGIQILYR